MSKEENISLEGYTNTKEINIHKIKTDQNINTKVDDITYDNTQNSQSKEENKSLYSKNECIDSSNVQDKNINNKKTNLQENTTITQQCYGILDINEQDRQDRQQDNRENRVEKKLYGFLRNLNSIYETSNTDIYVPGYFIKNFKMHTGDVVIGEMKRNQTNEKYNIITNISTINGKSVEEIKKRKILDDLTATYPNKQIKLETSQFLLSTRIIDLFVPVGFGQRGLIVAQPKSGKTMLLKDIANGITTNYPDVKLMVLLIDERPEEVTDMKRSVKGEVISSTFDKDIERHIRTTMLTIERAKRYAEQGKNVVILMDSMTRFARACNNKIKDSGRVLSGGLDINAMYLPKKFFGAARNTEEGGSLTIIATALVETGSKMDDVIFEELKGTGNWELQLNRDLAERRIFPAIDITASGTRKEELLLDNVNRITVLRQLLNDKPDTTRIPYLIDKLTRTKSNKEFIDIIG